MARLYSDLLDGTGRRYYFGLNSAPGGITNATPAMLTLFGNTPAIQEQSTVFRNPATAMLTLLGQLASAEPHLIPAPAALSMGGQIPGEQRILIITNALPPDYTTLPDNAPTIVYIQTITPVTAALQMQSLEHNVTPGGNIAFVSPGKATLTLQGYTANLPHFGDTGLLTINGLQATLFTQLNITPDPATLVCGGFEALLSLPFSWVDDDPVAPPTWIDD